MVHAITAIFYTGHFASFILYLRVRDYIDGSYTSYTSNNEFGYSNAEKSIFREENKRVIRVIFLRGILSVILSSQLDKRFAPLPLFVCSILGYTTLAENWMYVQQFWKPGILKLPKGQIPRSRSGRLL